MARKSRSNPSSAGAKSGSGSSISGGSSATKSKPKRIRRKCSAPNCTNRVVQGGVCVTHGAKRKLCSAPNCTKAVKLAGFCSTHGPARRKCDAAGCTRVAVQGGKCLSHGARRRVCCYPLGKMGGERCTKNAIMGGMCKKHYDRVQEAEGMLEMSLCVPVASSAASAGTATTAATVTSPESNEAVGMSLSDGSVDNGEGGDLMSLSGAPSWGSAMTSVTSGASTIATAPSNLSEQVPPPPAALPPAAPRSSSGGGHRHRRSKNIKPSHQRGLSIFDEMQTVDAIIGSGTGGGEGQPGASSPQGPEPMASSAVPVPPLPPVPSVKYPQGTATKTPTPQVSFADCVSGPAKGTAAPSSGKPCMGNASCTCDACRSPTLAIFEQMIQASQKLEKGDLDLAKYAGLSPPKLSPRKTSSSLRDSRMRDDTSCPESTPVQKNVSFLPDEPTSTGSVVRKVSSNNIVGEGAGYEENASSTQVAEAPKNQDHQVHHHQEQYPKDYHNLPPAGQGEGPEGPASHALASMAAARDDASVSRTVSHDVDDGRHHHHHHYYYPRHDYHHNRGAGAPPPLPPPQYSHHHHASYHHRGGPPPPPQPHYSHGSRYPGSEYSEAPPPHPSAREAPPPPPYYPPSSSHHHHAAAAAAAHHHYHRQSSHSSHEGFHPPQTPTLYDVSTTPPRDDQEDQPMAVVSTHSTHHHHCDQHLLPKRREAIEHLFIPKD